MKPNFCVLFVMAALTAGGYELTNNVSLGETGFRLVITDDEELDSDFKADTEVEAGRPLWWMLHRPETNRWRRIVSLGLSNSFALTLRTADGAVVPLTAKGKGMNQGPRSLTNLRANPRARWIGGGLVDFPPLEDLFRFPSNGVYYLEVRYWVWSVPRQRFELSAPVRLRVLRK